MSAIRPPDYASPNHPEAPLDPARYYLTGRVTSVTSAMISTAYRHRQHKRPVNAVEAADGTAEVADAGVAWLIRRRLLP